MRAKRDLEMLRYPHFRFLGGDSRASQVPGKPSANVPWSRTPAEHSCLALAACPCSLPPNPTASASAIIHFGAQCTARLAPCVRFATTVTRRHATLGSGWWLTFAGRDLLPSGFLRKVSATSHSPFPGFAWRTGNRTNDIPRDIVHFGRCCLRWPYTHRLH